MIHTSRQLKALVRNLSAGNSAKAQAIIRVYMMERFLERLSLSPYKSNLILKGGVLVSSMVGIANRTTMDVDSTIKGFLLTHEDIQRIVLDISIVPIEDNVSFELKSIATIMDETEYPGVRVMLDAILEDMHTPIKIDFSTGDVITPREISYKYSLMFEDRSITLLAYNRETVLAEKMETIITRGVANTRMRDFYDVYTLGVREVDVDVLREAFSRTVGKRHSEFALADSVRTLDEIESDLHMVSLWDKYRRKFDFASEVTWENVMVAVRRLHSRIV